MSEYIRGGMPPQPLTDRNEYILLRPTGHGRVIDVAKEHVPILDPVRRWCPDLRRVGREYEARCPIHEERTPSFRVNPVKGYFYCHGCGVGGDVVELFKRVHGHDRADVAAAELLMEFGFEPPQRPQSYFRRQERQRPIRDAIGRERFDHLRRRLYRAFFEPSVLAIEDAAEREEERRILWDATEPLARMMAREVVERRTS